MRFLALFSILVLWGAGLSAQNLMYYTSEAYNFTIQLPEEWKRSDMPKSEKIALVMLGKSGASLSVTFYELGSLTEQQFVDRYEKSLAGSFDKLVLQEKGVLKSRDDEATYLVYDYATDKGRMKEKVCFYHREGEIALITAKQEEENFHKNLPTFDKVFKSFTFETDQDLIEDDLIKEEVIKEEVVKEEDL